MIAADRVRGSLCSADFDPTLSQLGVDAVEKRLEKIAEQ
jgi:hypothetical protein